jgi:HAD superfamily hydrolase (TIGR01549 family)
MSFRFGSRFAWWKSSTARLPFAKIPLTAAALACAFAPVPVLAEEKFKIDRKKVKKTLKRSEKISQSRFTLNQFVGFIFFDWNGTIQQELGQDKAEKLHRRTLRLYSAHPDLLGHVDFDTFHGHIRDLKLGQTEDCIGNHDVINQALASCGVTVSPEQRQSMIDMFHNDAADGSSPHSLMPEAKETLEALKSRGYRLGLIRNSKMPEAAMRQRLQRLGVEHYFDVVVMSGDVGCEKPDPRIFQEAQKRADVDHLPPQSIIFIGNETEVDIHGANAVGWRSVLVQHTQPSSEGAAHHEIPSLAALLNIVPDRKAKKARTQ